MKRRFEDLIRILDYDELMRLKGDLDNGAVKVKLLLEEKIKKKLREHERTCTTCSNSLNFYSASNYTLVFGPDDFKKKASFCGLDCLEYFTIMLRDVKRKPQETMKKTD